MRVVDLTDHRGDIGPWILGELGADVIKVEPPEGCATRHANPLNKNDTSDLRSLHFGAYASNKRSIALDLDESSDRELFLKLIEVSDFLMSLDCRPSTEKAGLDRNDIEAINPQLVQVLIHHLAKADQERMIPIARSRSHRSAAHPICRAHRNDHR